MKRSALAILVVLAACGGGKAASSSSTATSSNASRATSSSTAQATTTTAPTTTAPAQPVVVLDISGSNKTNTDDFTVNGRWSITVEISGGAGANVVINKPDGGQFDFVQFDENGGRFDERGSGTFYLEVTPYGSTYHLVVTDDPG